MTRRSLLSMLAALFTMLVMSFATPETASAQQDVNCCKYTVDIAGVDASCFRVPLWIRWGNGVGVLGPQLFLANGVYEFRTPTCPAPIFEGAMLDANGPLATYNNPVCYLVNNCRLVVRIAFDANGCVIIYIRPC